MYLTDEGVLTSKDASLFTFSSPLIRALVHSHVSRKMRVPFPDKPVPLINANEFDLMRLITSSLPFIHKEAIASAFLYASKTSRVQENQGKRVPREAVYHFEHSRVLRSWFHYNIKLTPMAPTLHPPDETEKKSNVTPELSANEKRSRSSRAEDLLIELPSGTKYIIEYAATLPDHKIISKFSQAEYYRDVVGASKALLVHFTVFQPTSKHPYPYPDEQEYPLVEVFHIWHDSKFEKVKIYSKTHPEGEDVSL